MLVKWLKAEKSLREQGLTETTVVMLRKKYFFSDQNVDQNDTVQLNLLYVQIPYLCAYVGVCVCVCARACVGVYT